MNDLRPGQHLVIVEDFAFTCPFCQARVAYATVEGLPTPTVTHALPVCRKFRRLDGSEYLQACLSEICKNEPN